MQDKQNQNPFGLIKSQLKELGYEDLPLDVMSNVLKRLTGIPLTEQRAGEIEQILAKKIAELPPKI